MNEENTTFSKLFSEDKLQVFRLKVEWEEDYFKLFMAERNNAWFALVTTEHLTKLAEQHDINFVEYMENIRKYICNALPHVTIKKKAKTAEFVMYHHIIKELKYFVIELEKLDYREFVEELIDMLTFKCNDMCNILLTKDEHIHQMERENALLEKRCIDLAEVKAKSDNQIYSAVALVLNEKKNRIQYLTELLEAHESGNRPSTKHANDIKQQPQNEAVMDTNPFKQNPSTSKSEVMSDSEASLSDGYDTDNEKLDKSEIKEGDSLDFLAHGSPPPPIVSKSFKTDGGASLSNHTLSVVPPDNSETKEEQTENQSQSAHYDTQDFLDMM